MPHISFLAYNSIEYRFFHLVLVVLLRRDKSKYTYERIKLSHTCIPNGSFSINKFYAFLKYHKADVASTKSQKIVCQSDYHTFSCVLKSVFKDYVKLFSVVRKNKKMVEVKNWDVKYTKTINMAERSCRKCKHQNTLPWRCQCFQLLVLLSCTVIMKTIHGK